MSLNYDKIALVAANAGDEELVRKAIKMGANNIDDIAAATHGYLPIVKYMIELGANNIEGILIASTIYKDRAVSNYIRNSGLIQTPGIATYTKEELKDLTVVQLKNIANIRCVSPSGLKDEIIERILLSQEQPSCTEKESIDIGKI